MKKSVIIFTMLLSSGIATMAQSKEDILKYQGEAKRMLASFEKTPKNEEKFYSQLELGESLMNLYETNTKKLTFTTTPDDLSKIYLGVEPVNVEEKVDGQKKIKIYTYPYIRLTFIDGRLRSWDFLNIDVDNILDKALSALNKASALNKKNDSDATKKLETLLTSIRQCYNINAFVEYYKSNYKGAYTNTLTYLDLTEKIKKQDTTAQVYTIYYAHDAGMKDELLQSFNKTVSKNYREAQKNRGQMFVYAYNVYMERKDTVNAVNTMLKGAQFYPDNYDMVIKLIDLYRIQKKPQEAIAFIDKAKKLNPENPTLFLIEASLQKQIGNDSLSLVLYKKVIELDPKNFKSYLNLGASEFELGRKMLTAATAEKDTKVYIEKKKLAEDQLNIAVPYLEKAAELNPDTSLQNAEQIDILQTLRSLYYLLRTRYPEYKTKYDALDAKLPKATPPAKTTAATPVATPKK